MAKDIIKEIIIILLILLAIILVLGVILYNYMPNGIKLPDKISYVIPDEAKQALKSTDGVDIDKVILTYEINQTDLNNYQRISEYKPGKTNPFSSYEKKVEETSQTTGTVTGTGTSQSGSSQTTTGGSGIIINQNGNQSTNTTTDTQVDTTEPGTVNPGNYVPDKGTK